GGDVQAGTRHRGVRRRRGSGHPRLPEELGPARPRPCGGGEGVEASFPRLAGFPSRPPPPPGGSRVITVLERRVLAHGMAALVSLRLESAGFLAAFSERDGGISEGPFQSLNLGLRSGDRGDSVSGNRRRLCEALGVPPFACGRQAHGSRLARAGRRRAGAGFDDPAFAFPRTDALTTAERGIPLAVLAADCVPVALADPVAGRVAVVHAGWRG